MPYFFGKIALVAGVQQKMPESPEAFTVQVPSGQKAQKKDRYKIQIPEQFIGTAEPVVDAVGVDGYHRHRHAHSPVKEIEEQESEHPICQAAVIQVITFVPRSHTGQDCRGDKSDDKGKEHCQQDPLRIQGSLPRNKGS